MICLKLYAVLSLCYRVFSETEFGVNCSKCSVNQKLQYSNLQKGDISC